MAAIGGMAVKGLAGRGQRLRETKAELEQLSTANDAASVELECKVTLIILYTHLRHKYSTALRYDLASILH